MMILKEVIVMITFICLTKADCPPESPAENVTLTCYPEKNEDGKYKDETLCISQCDYNTVEHNCIDGNWDTDINNHGCFCKSIGSTRGGEWICSPTVSSITSQIQEGTRCIFKCGEQSADVTECIQRQWSKDINQFACEDGFHCTSLNSTPNGNWLCEDTYIQEDTLCRLTCDLGYSAKGQDVNICLTDGTWTLDNFQCVKVTPDATNGVLLLGGTGNAKPLQTTSFFAPSNNPCLTSLASMPVAREKSGAAMTSDNSIVLCGGSDMNGDPLDTCSKYFPLEDKWDNFPSLIQPRVSPTMVNFQNKLVVLGGYGGDIDLLDSLEVYEQNGWTMGIELPLGANKTIDGACAVTSSGLLYLIGGYSGGQGYLGSMYVLSDVNSPEWIEKEQMYINRRKHACLVTTVNNQEGILVSGGLTGPALKSTEFYSFETRSWEILGDLQVGRIGHSMAEIDGEIYVFGGSGLDSIEIFERGSNTWLMTELALPGDNYQFSTIPVSSCLKPE